MVVQFQRGSLNAWEASPIVPEEGQMVVAYLDDGGVDSRIGDGVGTWPDLPSVGAAGNTLTARLDRVAVDAISEGVPADGVTNCTPQLQALLDNNDIVYLPAGVYAISASLRLKSNQILFGAGPGKTIIRALLSMPNNLNLIMSANTNTAGVEHSNYANNIVLRDLTVDGRAFDRDIVIPNDTHGCNIKFSTVRDSRIINVESMNGVLHNIDVCASQYQVTPAPGADGDVNYQPLGPSERVLISDCISIDSNRDDPITCHNSSDILIQRCVSKRIQPLGSGDIHGIEIDEGCWRVAVVDCTVYDHNAGFQVKGHTNTTPSWDVSLVRCRAIRCRTSFHIYHDNPAEIPVGMVSWAKNVSLIDCASIDPELKAIVPLETLADGVSISGYRNVQIRNLILRGGSGDYANDIVLDAGCDDILIDGVYAIDVCPEDTGTGRAFITAASAYGQGSNRVTVRNVVVEGTLAIPVFRATGSATSVELDGITATGTAGPMVYLAAIDGKDHVERLQQTGYASEIQIGAGTAIGTYTGLQILPGYTLVMSGTVSPDSAVTAPPGTIYNRTTGGAGTTRYLKQTGVGNTGWSSVV